MMQTSIQAVSTLIALLLPLLAFSAPVVPGGVYLWPIPEGASQVSFQNKPVMRVADAALIGIPISQATGAAALNYRLGSQQLSHEFIVMDKAYTEQHITLTNKAMVNPPPASLDRIREESVRQRALYNTFADPVDLGAGFKMPLHGITTSLYGHRRFFNGEPRSPHSGLDIAADPGTIVRAAGNATITLADNLYFNGNTLFLDHGQGLITMYCHLSELLVDVGDSIIQGQEIGKVGATGRATGPHLHWSVSLNGNRVDPELFMQALNAQTVDTAADPN